MDARGVVMFTKTMDTPPALVLIAVVAVLLTPITWSPATARNIAAGSLIHSFSQSAAETFSATEWSMSGMVGNVFMGSTSVILPRWDRELAGRHDLRTRDVARAAQAVAECSDVEYFTDAQIERVAVDVGLRRQPLQRCLEIDDDDALRESRQRRQHTQALRHDVRVRREEVVGQRLPCREMLDIAARLAEEPQLVLHAARLARTARTRNLRYWNNRLVRCGDVLPRSPAALLKNRQPTDARGRPIGELRLRQTNVRNGSEADTGREA